MKINQYLVKTACPSSSGTLLPDHCLGVFVKHIEQAGLLAVALGATVVLATGCFYGTPTSGLGTQPIPDGTCGNSS
jgi:hypothetical protein